MRIAIVDDIASERETLKAGLDTQLTRLSLDAAVYCFGFRYFLFGKRELP